MMRILTIGVVAATAFATMAVATEPEKKPEKPIVSCEKIVEFYKGSLSVDETSDGMLVDQSRVVECLKAAGIDLPNEYDR
jgi:hypothetical protein